MSENVAMVCKGQCFIEKLPAELMLEIFSYIKKGRKRRPVMLVNHYWKDLMGPMLWRDLEIVCPQTRYQSLQAALERNSNYVRFLTLSNAVRPTEDQSESESAVLEKSIFVGLMDAIPFPKLKFLRMEMIHHVSTIDSVLPFLENLEYLEVNFRKEENQKAFAITPTPSLPKLKTLHLEFRMWNRDFKGDVDPCLEPWNTSRELITLASKLEDLRITADGCLPLPTIDRLFNPSTSIRIASLARLSLSSVCIGDKISKVFKSIDFLNLRALWIDKCHDLDPFLNAITEQFKHQPSQLRELMILDATFGHVAERAQPSSYVGRVEELLRSCSGLRILRLCFRIRREFDLGCLEHHSSTLQQLWLRNIGVPICSPTKLRGFLPSCHNLQDLAFNLVHCWSDRGCFHSLGPDGDRLEKELMELMSAIAAIKSLRTVYMYEFGAICQGLRPLSWWGDEMGPIIHECAIKILEHLVAQGSQINMLAFKKDPFERHWFGKILHYEKRGVDASGLVRITVSTSTAERCQGHPRPRWCDFEC